MRKINDQYNKHILEALVLILIIISYLVMKPILTAIIWGILLAYIFSPVNKHLMKYTRNVKITSAITCAVIVLVVFLGSYIAITGTLKEVGSFYRATGGHISEDILKECYADSTYCSITNSIREALSNPSFKSTVNEVTIPITRAIINSLTNAVINIPKLIITFVIALLVTAFTLVNGESLLKRIKAAIPLSNEYQIMFIRKFDDMMYALIYGSFVISVIQGIIALTAFWIFGIGNPIFWSIALAFFAFLPFIGTWVIWMPAGLIKIIQGASIGAAGTFWQGIGILAVGFIILWPIDLIIKPKFIGTKVKTSGVVILTGIIGGIIAFGIVGFIIGPIILGTLKTFFEIYEKILAERNKNEKTEENQGR